MKYHFSYLISLINKFQRVQMLFCVFAIVFICFVFINLPMILAKEEQTTQKLNLQECIELALKTYPEIKIAQAEQEEISEKYKEINANYFPKFSIGTSYSRLEDVMTSKMKYLGQSLNDYQTSLYLKQFIYDGGKTKQMKELAHNNISVEGENLRNAQSDLIYSVKKAYYSVIFAENMVKVREESVRQIEAHVDVANSMYVSGKVPKIDVLRAEVQFANVKQELSKAQNTLEIALAQLKDLIGWKIDTPLLIDTQIGFEESVLDLQYYVETAFESNPQWRRINFSVASTKDKIKLEKSAYLPNINFRADYGYEWGNWPPKENIWHLGVGIDIPLWDGGIAKARVNQAKASLEKMEETKKLIAKQIALQIQKSYFSLKEAEGRLITTEKSIEQAKESLRITSDSYKLGKGISRDVIDAQVALTQAQTNYIQALIDMKLAKADLERIIGNEK